MSATGHPTKPERLAARVTSEQKNLIQRAADLEGRSLTDFVIASAEAAARETIRIHEVMQLSQEGTRAFFEAIENPPEPNERLLQAAERYRKLVRS